MNGSTRSVALLCATAAALALGIALASERWGGLVPCALCLLERWPYRAAILIGLIAFVLPPRAGRIALWLLLVPLAAAILLGAIHVGVEQGFWPSPLPECSASSVLRGGGSIAERLAALPAMPAKPCDDPTYLVPGLPLSMAAMNLLYAAGFAVLLAAWLLRTRGRPA